MEESKSMSSVVWQPNPLDLPKLQVEIFRRKLGVSSLEELFSRAAKETDWFWGNVLSDLEIEFNQAPTSFYKEGSDKSRPIWCENGKMNIVCSALDKWVLKGQGEKVAISYENEAGHIEKLSYFELLEKVKQATRVLRNAGVKPGSVVALMMPMNAEVVIAFLAIIRCGGIVLPLFSGFGISAIVSRLQESSAEFAIVSEKSARRGKSFPIFSTFQEALEKCPRLQRVWVSGEFASTRRIGKQEIRSFQADLADLANGCDAAEVMLAEDPLLLIFSSGTTGKPKGIVHSHCGFGIKAAQDMKHAMNLGQADTLFWLTDIGWMMGPWVILGSLIGGLTLALYDGAPDFPSNHRLWNFVQKHQVTFLGLSPVLARSLSNAVDSTPNPLAVASLKAIGSTGSPWDLESWHWVFEKVLQCKKPIINYSGGTEISGGILCGNFHTKLKPCAFSGPVLGMDADVFDAAGNPVHEKIGELVIKNNWIGMARGFWKNDPRYTTTYWSRFERIWLHGDNAIRDSDGLWYIVGRSDDTIKVAGKRLGPAEVESIVNQNPEVAESAAVGAADPIKGESLIVYCVPKTKSLGAKETASIKNNLAELIAKELGKPLAPKEIRFVNSLPKTRNAKVMHRIIRSLYENPNISALGEISSLENIDSLDDIIQYY